MTETVKDDWRQIIIFNEFCQYPIDDLSLNRSTARRSKYQIEVHIFLLEQLLEVFYILMPFHKHFRNRFRQENLSDTGLCFRLFHHQSSVCACHRRRELEHYTLFAYLFQSIAVDTLQLLFYENVSTIVLNSYHRPFFLSLYKQTAIYSNIRDYVTPEKSSLNE